MSEYPNPGMHPDADSLSAFAEGVLPEHERLACVAHLAECARCREIVWMAQPAIAEEHAPAIENPVPFWKRWFVPVPALVAAAVACVLVVSVTFYRQQRPVVPAPELTASVTNPAVTPTPATQEQPIAPIPRARVQVNRDPVPAAEPVPAPAINGAPAPAPPASIPAQPSPAPVIPRPSAPALARFQAVDTVAGVAGTVTDPAGAVIPNARVSLVDDATGRDFTSATDPRGQFNIAGLAPGRYRMNITSPGFMERSQQVDVQPQQMARLDSRLEVGAATDTVAVTAGASLLKTESGELSRSGKIAAAETLPVLAAAGRNVSAGPTPPTPTVSRDKIHLTVDSGGALLFSKDAGKTWKQIKGKWQGKVVSLNTTPDPANASKTLFQLTTDSASVWLSRDGNRWYLAPARP